MCIAPSDEAAISEAGGDINDLPSRPTEYPLDAFPQDPAEWRDSDGDGIGNNADPEDDNDGASDDLDILPEDPDWSIAVAATATVGAQLIARYEGALADPDINFADPRNGATIELVHPSFPIVKQICRIARLGVLLDLSERVNGFPRDYLAQFRRFGFPLWYTDRETHPHPSSQIFIFLNKHLNSPQ